MRAPNVYLTYSDYTVLNEALGQLKENLESKEVRTWAEDNKLFDTNELIDRFKTFAYLRLP